jgi:hypothetical protein
MKTLAIVPALVLAACSTSNTPEPSLARRPAEAIDPRIPVDAAPIDDPADPALSGQVDVLLSSAGAAAAQFEAGEPRVRALADAAGPAQSESWIAAQSALSELGRFSAPAAAAASDLDLLRSVRARSGQPMLAADLALLESAASQLRAINDRLGERLAAIGAQIAR